MLYEAPDIARMICEMRRRLGLRPRRLRISQIILAISGASESILDGFCLYTLGTEIETCAGKLIHIAAGAPLRV